MSDENKPANLWERGGQSPDAYKDSPDARPDKRPVSKLFDTPANNNPVFTGSRVGFATGANGRMAVNIDDNPMTQQQQYGGFAGYPWIVYALSNDGNGYDVGVGHIAVGNTPGPAAAIEQLQLVVANSKNALSITNLNDSSGTSLSIEMEDLAGGGSVLMSGLAANTLGLTMQWFNLTYPNPSGCGTLTARVLGAQTGH